MPEQKKISVLVAEDQKELANLLDFFLKTNDFDVTITANGHEAKTAMKGREFDFLVTDIIMPEMDGILLLKWMEQQHYKTQVVIASGVLLEEEQIGNADKVILIIEKPYTPEKLVSLVATLKAAYQAKTDYHEF